MRISAKIPLALAFALAATQAFAHAQLEKSTPPVGGTVHSAKEIRLEFSEGVEPRFTKVELTRGDGSVVQLGAQHVEGADKNVLVVPTINALAPGAYTVHWHAVAVDTHHTQGDFSFTVQP